MRDALLGTYCASFSQVFSYLNVALILTVSFAVSLLFSLETTIFMTIPRFSNIHD